VRVAEASSFSQAAPLRRVDLALNLHVFGRTSLGSVARRCRFSTHAAFAPLMVQPLRVGVFVARRTRRRRFAQAIPARPAARDLRRNPRAPERLLAMEHSLLTNDIEPTQYRFR